MVKVHDARANNFNLLRLVAASAVIFSHAAEIAGARPDAIEEWIGYSGGWIAVSAFFSISGFLIYRSMVSSRNVKIFMVARGLRIFPGLWVMLVLTTMVLGLTVAAGGPSSYFTSPQVYEYVAGNAVLYAPQYHLPGVFDGLPTDGVVNGSLWTLRFEFACYLAVVGLFVVGAFASNRRFASMCVVYVVGYVGFLVVSAHLGSLDAALHDGSDVAKLHRLSLAFMVGVVVARLSDRARPAWWWVGIGGLLCLVSFGTPLFQTALVLLVAALVFCLAFFQAQWLHRFRSMHDYSYGIYIYAFPVQQAVQLWLDPRHAIVNALISLVIVVPLAALSWQAVESPALRLKSRLQRRATP
ncbi:acyltransferase family protein [Aeromicrobium erythreum]|uniref:Acyltransferase 3 domain-containing protein n=1 Tax=Aeromicrobium erythreum TaxID=2041 RepID=A0A0U3KN85_9ACTN|nr:acyltransferase [Aeromicrobium erythreum]ALX06035.1 hypothetical protein AERYTH_15675 [Aeromicrobium erythreum]